MEVLLPESLAELLTLRAKMPEGRILAGGTDLLVQLRKAGQRPPMVICTDRVAELAGIGALPGEIHIGAAVTLQRLVESSVIREHLPALHQAASVMASPPVRHAATLGGNLCTASPAGDTLPPLYVLGAWVILRRTAGERSMPLEKFLIGPGETMLQPDEVLTAVRIPRPHTSACSSYHKVGRRQAMAIAVASMAASLEWDQSGRLARIKLAWGSVGPGIVTLPEVERFIAQRDLSEQTLRTAAKLVYDGVRPINDVRAGADYRRRLAGNLLLRLLAEA